MHPARHTAGRVDVGDGLEVGGAHVAGDRGVLDPALEAVGNNDLAPEQRRKNLTLPVVGAPGARREQSDGKNSHYA